MFKTKNNFKEWYEPQDSFVVRNPLLSLETFFNWKADDEENIESTKEVLRRSLREFYMQPIAQEALLIGSSDLTSNYNFCSRTKLKRMKKRKTELSLKVYDKNVHTLHSYGLFVACTVGKFDESTNVQLSATENLCRYGRLDMDYVCELHADLLKQKKFRANCSFSPILYTLGDQ
jgi:hypothetical protein